MNNKQIISDYCRGLGEVIRENIKAQKKAINHVADFVGVSDYTMYMIVRGHRAVRIDTLYRIAEELNVPLWKIIKEADRRVGMDVTDRITAERVYEAIQTLIHEQR